MKASKVDKHTYYRGVRMIPYDLLKEVSIAMIGVLGFVLILVMGRRRAGVLWLRSRGRACTFRSTLPTISCSSR